MPWRRSCDPYNRPAIVHQCIDGSSTDSLGRAGNDNELGHSDCCLPDVHADRLAAADTGNTSTSCSPCNEASACSGSISTGIEMNRRTSSAARSRSSSISCSLGAVTSRTLRGETLTSNGVAATPPVGIRILTKTSSCSIENGASGPFKPPRGRNR